MKISSCLQHLNPLPLHPLLQQHLPVIVPNDMYLFYVFYCRFARQESSDLVTDQRLKGNLSVD